MRGRIALSTLGLLLLASTLLAQTNATGTSRFQFDETGQSTATAGGATYTLYLDGATTGQAVPGINCIAGAPVPTAVCTSGNLSTFTPALSPGAHSAQMTQTISANESAKSTALAMNFIVTVTPSNLRIVKLLTLWKGGVLTSRGREALRPKVTIRRIP